MFFFENLRLSKIHSEINWPLGYLLNLNHDYVNYCFQGSQRWKLDGTVLHSKEEFISNAEWYFKPGKGGLIHVAKLPEKKVIGITGTNWCTLEDFSEDRDDQLWKKGEPDNEGYFTLENSTVPKLITVTSSGFTEGTESFGFKLEGNSLFGSSVISQISIYNLLRTHHL